MLNDDLLETIHSLEAQLIEARKKIQQLETQIWHLTSGNQGKPYGYDPNNSH